jgi:hypothetical protein
MEDVFASHEKHPLGFEPKTKVSATTGYPMVRPTAAGSQQKYVIAFNSFDARSGGHHFMKLRSREAGIIAFCMVNW